MDLNPKEVKTGVQRTFEERAFQLVGRARAKALSNGESACSQTSESREARAEQLGEGLKEAGIDRVGPCKALDFDSE